MSQSLARRGCLHLFITLLVLLHTCNGFAMPTGAPSHSLLLARNSKRGVSLLRDGAVDSVRGNSPLRGGAIDSVGEGERGVKVPDTWELAKFAVPTLGIWLSNPILSLVDSAVVGRFCSSSELAALSPGTVVCDSSAYIFMFLAVATTNLYATALAQKNNQKAAGIVRHSLFLALSLGLFLSLLIHLFAPRFLTFFTGEKAGQAVLYGAMTYASIRAWGSPAALLTNVAQAACFGDKDAVTPLRAVWLAGALNLLGDVTLVRGLGWGLTGAALATVAAQYAGLVYILLAVRKRQQELMGKTMGLFQLFDLPSERDFREYLSFAGPAFFALMGKVVSISSMTYAAAGAGTISLAAHQVLIQVFFFFCKFGDSVSSTAQAFLPGAMAAGARGTVVVIIRRCLTMAFILGSIDSILAGAVPLYCAGLFTKDAAVAAQMAAITPILCTSLLFHATVMALEGILFACRRMKYLAGSYIITTVGFTCAMYVARGAGVTLRTVWLALFSYQITRLIQFGIGLGIELVEEGRKEKKRFA